MSRIDLSFHFFRTVARIFGSIFFPLFSSWGEDDVSTGSGKIVFCQNFGVISLINVLRFFAHPVTVVVRESQSTGFVWTLARYGGLKLCRVPDSASAESFFEVISAIHAKSEIPLVLVSEGFLEVDDAIISKYETQTPSKVLFLAVSASKKCFFAGFIPVIRNMKILCVTLPVFCAAPENLKGLNNFNFLEAILEQSADFEIPSLFHNHSQNKNISEKL